MRTEDLCTIFERMEDEAKELGMKYEEATRMSRDARYAGLSDGTTADYYELPPGATELQDLISFKNMNSQLGEIGRSWYRYGQASHSDMLRDINKIIFYAQAEKARLEKYVLRSDANIRSGNEPRT